MDKRAEKNTLQLHPAIIARGPKAVLLADQISRLGGELQMSDEEISYTVPEENLEAAAKALTAFCSVREVSNHKILIPAGDDFEGAEWMTDDDQITVPE